eukprot:m.384877 g.384877  ORF g.384877 m.384877 type:complete len:111 (+) comp16736_c0_seq7:1083-1415(+)
MVPGAEEGDPNWQFCRLFPQISSSRISCSIKLLTFGTAGDSGNEHLKIVPYRELDSSLFPVHNNPDYYEYETILGRLQQSKKAACKTPPKTVEDGERRHRSQSTITGHER